MSLAVLDPTAVPALRPLLRPASPAPLPLRPSRSARGERARIERELTAVVADGIARARAHATAAQRLLAGHPGSATTELGQTIACARVALDEMRTLVGALRSAPGEAHGAGVRADTPAPRAASAGDAARFAPPAASAGETARPAPRAVTAGATERARLARELHDVVGASFAVISVQAGAARVLAHLDPAAAGIAIGHVLEAADRALAEVAGLVPRATVADAVARARPTRLWIDLDERGDATVCAQVEHAAARIVQEALTNAHEHGATADPRVRVRVERSAAGLRLTVVNAVAPRATASARGGGFGVAGMHERARAVGGTCAAGRLANGAWLVRATLPAQAA